LYLFHKHFATKMFATLFNDESEHAPNVPPLPSE
jgi:hypothetical protein